MVSLYMENVRVSSKLKLHTAEADGVSRWEDVRVRSKLKLHAAEADGVFLGVSY